MPGGTCNAAALAPLMLSYKVFPQFSSGYIFSASALCEVTAAERAA